MVRTKRARSEKAIVLRCNVDGENVLASEMEVQKSALIKSFSVVPSTIDLPFTKQQAKAWITVQGDAKVATKEGMRMMTFGECTAALKVADFLQDEDTARKAANLANWQLRHLRPIPRNPQQWQKPCERDIQALKSLQPELAQNILKQEGSFGYWKHVLPRCCHSIALAASVTDAGVLSVSLVDCDKNTELVSVVQSLSPVLRKLSVTTGGNRDAFSDALKPLVHLDSLHVDAAGYPKLPSSLSALTRISIAAGEKLRGMGACSDSSGCSEGGEESEGDEESGEEKETEEEDEESGEEGGGSSDNDENGVNACTDESQGEDSANSDGGDQAAPSPSPSIISPTAHTPSGELETLAKLKELQRKIDSLDAVRAMQSDSSDSSGYDSDAGEVMNPLQRIRMDLCFQKQALMMEPSRYFRRFKALKELALSFKHEIVDCSRLAPRLLNLTTLTSLSLSCQKIHQYDAPMLATSLASCISLKQLSFYVKQDDDDFAYRFKSFDGDFDDFDFKFGNESAETVLKVLPALSKLTHLHLSRELGCRVLPDILPKLPELRHLVVDDLNAWGSTTHDAAVGAAVGTLRHLQHLSAADNFLSDKEIEPLLATLPTSLTCLNLEKNRLPGDFPRLSKLQKLRVLNLNYCGVTRAVAQRVTALTALETLLTNDAEMPPEATEALVAALPPCIEHVEIMGSHFPESAAPLLARLTALKVLHIGSEEMTDELEAVVRTHTAELPSMDDLTFVHGWEGGGGDEWFLAPRLED